MPPSPGPAKSSRGSSAHPASLSAWSLPGPGGLRVSFLLQHPNSHPSADFGPFANLPLEIGVWKASSAFKIAFLIKMLFY